MRVAMISMHTSPLQQPGTGDAGGMNVYVLSTANELGKRGIEVDIFTRATRPSQGEIVRVGEGVRVINIEAGPYDGLAKEELSTQLVAFAHGILEFSRKHEVLFDVIHSHYWLSGQVGWLLRDLWHVPLVHTAHTWAAVKNHHRTESDVLESEARRICEQQLVDNADVVAVNTAEERNDVISHYDAENACLKEVPPGADTRLFTPGTDRNTERARRALGIPLHAKVIAFVGRLQQFKGPDVLIKAVAKMVEENPDRPLRVVICGGESGAATQIGSYRSLACELGVSPYIRFLEPRPPEELVEIYRAADIVAVPSHNESFGLVALEAQAAGTPVVAAKVGGLPIAVQDGKTGVLVDGHKPRVWAEALIDVLDNDEARIAMGRAAVDHAAAFSWAETANRLAEIYQEACMKRP